MFQPRQPKSPRDYRVVRHTLATGERVEYRYPKKRPNQPDDPESVSALVEAYIGSPEWAAFSHHTRDSYGRYLTTLAEYGRTSFASIRRRDLIEIRDALAASSGHGTANRFIRTVSALYTWAIERQWLDTNPAARIGSLEGGHLRAWTAEEYTHALTVLPEPLRRAFVLARFTGQRRGDLVTMRWAQYDGRLIRLTQQKTRKALAVPVHSELRAELDAWQRPAPTILTTETGLAWSPEYLSIATRDAAKAMGLRGLNVHGLRKLAATSLAEAGCSAHEIMAITGHSTMSMVELYTKSAQQEKLAASAIARLENVTNKSEQMPSEKTRK